MRRPSDILLVALLLGMVTPVVRAESTIDASTSDGPHWAFQPLQPVALPEDSSSWSAQPIDRFVIARLRHEELQPVELADKRTLIRRAYLDLIGLPPTPEQVDAFLADESSDAFSKLIDRLLSSRHYGERWGRHWLDIVRYADTAGDNSDCPVPEMYRYRDYVIDAFNADKPYDEFLLEQLAGDLLVKENPSDRLAERVTATGYIALAKRYGNKAYENREVEIGDLIDCTGRGLLGVTMGCARCHDHKFDPMTAEDYYALYGIFDSTAYSFSGAEASKVRINLVSILYPREEYLQRKSRFDKEVQPLRDKILELEGENPITNRLGVLNKEIPLLEEQIKQRERDGEDISQLKKKLEEFTHERDEISASLTKQLKPLHKSLAEIEKKNSHLIEAVAFAASENEVANVPLQFMGDPDQPGDVIERGVPQFLSTDEPLEIPDQSSGRLEFARWLTRPGTVAEGLTARVIVNRIWQHHFGQGLVATPSNFGISGQPPSHPALLEWLAKQLVERGWSIKTMHRLIMLSQTYRLSSQDNATNRVLDPGDKFLWRYNRHRLEAEVIRDAMLAVSGNLDRTRPGPHPFPPTSEWKYSQHEPFMAVYPSRHRSVYLMTQRNHRHPYFAIFDGPDTNLSTGLRTRSILPQQALYLMNNPFVREQAECFAKQLIQWSSVTGERIARAHQCAWGRAPTAREIENGTNYLQTYQQQLQPDGTPDEKMELDALSSYGRLMLTANEFLYVE